MQTDDADGSSFSHQWKCYHRSESAYRSNFFLQLIFWIVKHVMDMDRAALDKCAAISGASSRGKGRHYDTGRVAPERYRLTSTALGRSTNTRPISLTKSGC